MQLAKYLCGFGRVIYDSLEESTGLSFQMSLKRHKMDEVRKRLVILDRESMEQLEERLQRRGSPGIVIIDSFQYSGLNYKPTRSSRNVIPRNCLSSSAMPRGFIRQVEAPARWNMMPM